MGFVILKRRKNQFKILLQIPFFSMCDQKKYIFQEAQKSNQDVIGDIYCPGSYSSVYMSIQEKRMVKHVANPKRTKHAATF